MGRWAQAHRRGSDRREIAPVSALVLSVELDGSFTWVWPGADPDTWTLQYFDVGDNAWTNIGSEPGVARAHTSEFPDQDYRLFGVDVGAVRITDYSNTVHSPP